MSVNIDPNFSVYNLTTRVDEQETAHLNHRRTMNVISYAIEDISVVDEVQTRVFAGFQRMSRFLPQVERYTKLAAVAESVYIFGIPDVEVPQIPNLTYIPISKHDRLSREWFLVSYGRDFHSTLATEEISHIDDDDDERVFKGIWTFDLGLNTPTHWGLMRLIFTLIANNTIPSRSSSGCKTRPTPTTAHTTKWRRLSKRMCAHSLWPD